MPYSEAHKRASLKNRAKNVDRIEIVMKKGLKDQYQTQAAKRGLSLNAYILSLLNTDAEKETEKKETE